MCRAAGIPVAGGHSIDSAEPIYGLVALGTVHPGRVRRNSGAQKGDVLVLTKGLGVGVFSAALKQGRLPDEGYRAMIASTTQLNAVGREVALGGVHAMTDVTGFGLLGHLLEMCRGAELAARRRVRNVPVLPGAAALAQAGIATGAAGRNWASCGNEVALPDALPDWRRGLLCDLQTSGGLLVAAAPEAVGAVLGHVRAAGFAQAAVVRTMEAGGGVAVIK